MVITMCSLKIANNGMERQQLNTSLLPCNAYRGDVHDYIASQISPHWHNELEIMIVDSGTVLVPLADDQFQLNSGEGYFVNAGKLHSVISMVEAPCQYRSLVFDPSIISGSIGSAFDTLYVRPFLEFGSTAVMLERSELWQQPIFDAFEEAFSVCETEPYGYEFTVRNALSQIVLSLAGHNNINPSLARASSQRENRLKQMVTWIDKNYCQQISLRSLAEAVNTSSRECERIFKQLLRISPMTYLMQRRITAASELLACSDLLITEVGLRCGFSSHSYFSKSFYSITGYKPRDYRTLIRSGSN